MNYIFALAAYLETQLPERVYPFGYPETLTGEPVAMVVLHPNGGPGDPYEHTVPYNCVVDCYGPDLPLAAELMDKLTAALRGKDEPFVHGRSRVLTCWVSEHGTQLENELGWPAFTMSWVINAQEE